MSKWQLFEQFMQTSNMACTNNGTSINSTHYCDASHQIKTKKTDDNTCTVNYECTNNNCMNDGKCHPISWECVNANAEYNSTHYCNANHKIQSKKANDNSCSQNYECQNGNCLTSCNKSKILWKNF